MCVAIEVLSDIFLWHRGFCRIEVLSDIFNLSNFKHSAFSSLKVDSGRRKRKKKVRKMMPKQEN